MTELGRRRFLGYLGTAAAGAAAGAGAGAWGTAALGAPDGRPVAALGATVAPYGRHQPGVAIATQPVTELVSLDLLPSLLRARDTDGLARLLRVWTGDIEALCGGRGVPGDTAPWLAVPGIDLTVTVGLGRGLLRRLRLPLPPGFDPIPAMAHDRLESRWSGGDLVLVVAGRDATAVGHAVRRLVADARPFATLRWRQVGAWSSTGPDGRPATGRNLFGQIDGSANPRPGTDLFDRTVWVPDGAWSGGTTLVVRRIRMDLSTWDELTRDEQERSIGRRLDDGAPITGGGELDDLDLAARSAGRWAIARDAHARRSHPSVNGGARIFRKGANYEVSAPLEPETGLLFQSYQASLADFVTIQRSLDELDALNEWTTAVGSVDVAVLPGFEEGDWLGRGVLEARP